MLTHAKVVGGGALRPMQAITEYIHSERMAQKVCLTFSFILGSPFLCFFLGGGDFGDVDGEAGDVGENLRRRFGGMRRRSTVLTYADVC